MGPELKKVFGPKRKITTLSYHTFHMHDLTLHSEFRHTCLVSPKGNVIFLIEVQLIYNGVNSHYTAKCFIYIYIHILLKIFFSIMAKEIYNALSYVNKYNLIMCLR